MTKVVNMAVRLEPELELLVKELRADRLLGVLLKTFFKAVSRDRVAVLSYLLGLADTTVDASVLATHNLKANQYADFLASGSENLQGYLETLEGVPSENARLSLTKPEVEELLLAVANNSPAVMGSLVSNVKKDRGVEGFVDTLQNPENHILGNLDTLEKLIETCVEKTLARVPNFATAEKISTSLPDERVVKRANSELPEVNESDLDDLAEEPTEQVGDLEKTLTDDQTFTSSQEPTDSGTMSDSSDNPPDTGVSETKEQAVDVSNIANMFAGLKM